MTLSKKKVSGQNIIFIGKVISDNTDITYTKLEKAFQEGMDVQIFYCRTNEFGEVLYVLDCFGKIQKLSKEKIDFLAYNELGAPEEHVLLLKYIENVSVQRTVYQALKSMDKCKKVNEIDAVFDNYVEFANNNIFMDRYKEKRTELENNSKDR